MANDESRARFHGLEVVPISLVTMEFNGVPSSFSIQIGSGVVFENGILRIAPLSTANPLVYVNHRDNLRIGLQRPT